MKTLLAAALLALPLAALPGEEKTPASDQAAQSAALKPAGEKATAKDTKGARQAAKPAEPKKDAGKKDEKPCEPVKPCSID